MVEKLAEILHELIDAAQHVLTPGRVGELHALVDEVAKPAETPAAAPKATDGAATA